MEEFLLEYVRIGNQVKVTACDPESGIEASIIGPVRARKKYLSDLAVKKLLYVMKKEEALSNKEEEE